MPENVYRPIRTELLEVKPETPTIKTFRMAPDEPIAFRAGQFVQLTVPGIGEAPFTPSSSPSLPDEMAITILKTGLVTDTLHELEAGADLGLRGPFGKRYPTEKMKGHPVVVVGGGVTLMGDVFLGPLRDAVAQRVFRPYAGSYEILPAALGEDVVLIGALLL